MQITIVALPREDDKVTRLSSEKAAHLTLLYLGDQVSPEDAAKIIAFVDHATSEMSPFGLTVDYRGELGPDQADVLFFEDNAWDIKEVKELRSNLLLNDTIKMAYDSVPQFEGWVPHLTLGYPATPANELKDEKDRVHSVGFDRVAVWTGDSSGPEFRLKYDNAMADISGSWASSEAALTGSAMVDGIFHHGVKGMKWGVITAKGAQSKATAKQKQATAMTDRAQRRSSKLGSAAEARKGAKLQKEADRLQRRADKKMEKVVNSSTQRGTVRRGVTKANVALTAGNKAIRSGESKLVFLPKDKRAKAARSTQIRVLSEAAKLNDSPKFSGKDLKTNTALRAAYHNEIHKTATKIYQQELTKVRAEALGEALHSIMSPDGSRVTVSAPRDKIQHADSNEETLLVLDFEYDADGFLSDVTIPENDMVHSQNDLVLTGAEMVDGIFHHGVKGMKWGVTTVDKASRPTLQREKQTKLMNTKDVTVTQRTAGRYVKTTGGQRQKASDDAVRAHAGRQKAKKSTTDSLTNDELRAVVERLRLEQEYSKLDSKVKRRGKGFIAYLFQSPEVKQVSADMAKRVAKSSG